MKIFLASLSLSVSLAAALPAAELLLNGNFESPIQTTNGDHLNTLPANWIVSGSATATTSTNTVSNLVRGQITGSNTTNSLGVSPYDTTTNSQGTTAAQSFDGNGQRVYLSETFTSSFTATAQIRISFGGRDGGSDTTATGSSWTLTNTATGVTVASATGFKPATGSWLLNSTTTPTLTSGASYRFQINLDDTAMVDAASITIVPEPSTLATLGGLMLLGGGCMVLRRARCA